ncbi:MAG: sulfate ABC transporter substrate-binding protein [Chromatiales bacterium]
MVGKVLHSVFLRLARPAIFAAAVLVSLPLRADVTLLNVSYDVSREFYKEYNPAFARHWKEATGETATINQSHGGSSRQARAVIDGLEADVVTMNQPTDIDALVRNGLVGKEWRQRFPHNSAPYASTTVFLVRKGNPKRINDWNDLLKPGVAAVIPNPKTSGNGRYTYLSAWVYALRREGSEEKARDFVGRLFRQVPVLDSGGRGATTTFAQRGIGDVLVTFENEVHLIRDELGADAVEIVYPTIGVLADAPVAVVDRVVNRRGTREPAEAYLDYLFSEQGQELAARHHLRPADEAIAQRYTETFPALKLVTVDETFGGWEEVQKTHFADGGVFDQIYSFGH